MRIRAVNVNVSNFFISLALFFYGLSFSVSLEFPAPWSLGLVLDDNGHFEVGILLLEDDDVGVAQAYATLALAARHRALVVGAAVYAYASVPWGVKAQEPGSVGLDVAASVVEVVGPSRGVANGLDMERLGLFALRSLVVALALFLPLVAAQAGRELCHEHGVASHSAIDI